MTEQDLPVIQKIEKLCYPDPWSEKTMKDCLKAAYQCIVVSIDNETVAYCFLLLAIDESQLLNITVAPVYQKKGIARLLLDRIKLISRIGHCHNIILEVKSSNKRALSIYQKYGFKQIGLRKNYYLHAGVKEDAIVMKLTF